MSTLTNEDPADPRPHEPKPAAYVVWAENGNCIMWTTNKAQALACAAKYERPMRELYDQDVVHGLLATEQSAHTTIRGMSPPLDKLNISKKTLNVLHRIGIRTIDDLTKWEVIFDGKSEPIKPSQAITHLIHEAGGGRSLPMGIDAFKELFDAMTLQLVKSTESPPADQQAMQLADRSHTNPPYRVYMGLPPSTATFDHCGNCVFFSTHAIDPDEVTDGSSDDYVEGNCLRYPPSHAPDPRPGQVNLIVDVESIGWCGEHKRRGAK
jgi:hypothetical protein